MSLLLCYLPALLYIRRSQSSVAEFFTSYRWSDVYAYEDRGVKNTHGASSAA